MKEADDTCHREMVLLEDTDKDAWEERPHFYHYYTVLNHNLIIIIPKVDAIIGSGHHEIALESSR